MANFGYAVNGGERHNGAFPSKTHLRSSLCQMNISHFRVRNFRSIVDTGWCRFGSDGVTVFVGQNESGKTSLLEALHAGFGTDSIREVDVRIGCPLPEMSLRIELAEAELAELLEEYDEVGVKNVARALLGDKKFIEFTCGWQKSADSSDDPFTNFFRIEGHGSVIDAELEIRADEILEELAVLAAAANEATAEGQPVPLPSRKPALQADHITDAIFDALPEFVLFSEDSSLLPNQIDVDESTGKLKGPGGVGARNFLEVANIDLKTLLESNDRTQETLLERANDLITRDFNEFWTQTIGDGKRLTLECQLKTRKQAGESVGKQYLVFWISDNPEKLYPEQRSKGVRWFLSFFLQMRASERKHSARFFLLDEPGASLHAKAQINVLALIERIRTKLHVVYTTHSPYLIEYKHWYRISAVQRQDSEDDTSPTTVIDSHSLASASEDTLSPILTAMGENLSHQQAIKVSGNIIVEELSAHYYLSAFWKLTQRTEPAYFVATTGVENVPKLAFMFLAWGLRFGILIDDDPHGREVFKRLKKELYRDDAELAGKHLAKLKDCTGIEDLFSAKDFATYVLKQPNTKLKSGNAGFVKDNGASKALLASQFLVGVSEGAIVWENLDVESQQNIRKTVDLVVEMLKEQGA